MFSRFLGAAEGEDNQEKITSSGREQIESFIGAVCEKIHPPAPAARCNPGNAFPPRQVGSHSEKNWMGLCPSFTSETATQSMSLLHCGHLLWTF